MTRLASTQNFSKNLTFLFNQFSSCSSFVGKVEDKAGQGVNLEADCLNYGTVLHELGHLVGFWHEHTRKDTHNYLKIFKQNIQPRELHLSPFKNPFAS